MSESYHVRTLDIHTDARGLLFEMLRFKDEDIEGKGYMYCFSINSGQRRGDHYHERKHEWVVCVSGQAVVLIETSTGKKERIVVRADSPAVVYFAPYTAHAFLNESDMPAVFVAYGSKQFDPIDPDTTPKFIED